MKTLILINPPNPGLNEPLGYAPLGLLYIAASCRRYGIDTQVLNLAAETLSSSLIDSIPDAEWYGLSIHNATFNIVREMATHLSRRGKVVIGGPDATAFPFKVASSVQCDYIVDGEGEYALPEIIQEKHKPGVVKAKRITCLDDLPFPARDLLPQEQIVSTSGIHWIDKRPDPATTIITSRGCPYRCAFCSKIRIMSDRWYPRSPHNVTQELISLHETYGVRRFRILDDVFNLDTNRLLKFCGRVKGLDFSFTSAVRADSLQDPEVLWWMRAAGIDELLIGVESPDDGILKTINKAENYATILQAFRNCREAGIKTKALLIFGLPGETLETVQKTKDFMREAQPDGYTLSAFTPLPGSAIYADPSKFGIQLDPTRYSGWFYDRDREGENLPEYLSDKVKASYRGLCDYMASGEWRK